MPLKPEQSFHRCTPESFLTGRLKPSSTDIGSGIPVPPQIAKTSHATGLGFNPLSWINAWDAFILFGGMGFLIFM